MRSEFGSSETVKLLSERNSDLATEIFTMQNGTNKSRFSF